MKMSTYIDSTLNYNFYQFIKKKSLVISVKAKSSAFPFKVEFDEVVLDNNISRSFSNAINLSSSCCIREMKEYFSLVKASICLQLQIHKKENQNSLKSN